MSIHILDLREESVLNKYYTEIGLGSVTLT
jgi:hypothetical protein